MNNTEEGEAPDGQTTEISPIQGENGDHKAPQPEEEVKGEEPAETGPPQPEEDRETGENLNEEAAEETQAQDPQPEVTGGWGSWLRWLWNLPLFHMEMSELVALGLCAIKFLSYVITFTSAFYIRTLGSAKIESLCLGIAMFNIAVDSVAIGLAQTFNTLISQTYGCGNMKRIGVIMQRAVLFACLLWFFSWSVLIYTEPIVLLLNRTPQVASDAQLYAYIMIPAVPACFLYQLQAKFLQNQNLVWPQLGTGFCVTILNWIVTDVLVRQYQLGLIGSAVSTAISHFLLALFLFIIIITKGLHKTTWPGQTQDCLQEWGSFSLTAFFSVMMLCAELWTLEAWIFICGTVDKVALTAQRLVYNAYIGAMALPMAFAETASVNVGNALGAKNAEKASSSFLVPLKSSGEYGVSVGVFLHIFLQALVFSFIEGSEVMEKAGGGLVFLTVFMMSAFTRVAGGGIRGAGKVCTAAVCNIVCHSIGFAISLCLASRGISGYGTGHLFGMLFQSICYVVIICKLDWALAIEKAQASAGILMGDEIMMIPRGPGAQAAPNDEQPVPVRIVTVVGDVLPWKEVVLRRVLALCFAVAVLIAASVGRVFVMKKLLDKGIAAASPPPSTIPASVLGE